jgi:7-carboxy-7-deazaguanine synthase
MEELPVFKTGCDSSYSWSKKFAHLAHTATAVEFCDKLEALLMNEHNPEGKFLHPKSGQWTHMAFTGGEPMLNQNAITDIMIEFAKRKNVPKYVTVETNGTQNPRDKFSTYLSGYTSGTMNRTLEDMTNSFYMSELRQLRAENYSGLTQEEYDLLGIEWFWSVSPKLFLSGEKKADALKPEIVKAYKDLNNCGQLKYVCDGSDRAWQEVEEFTQAYRDVGIKWSVYIMPVGGTKEEQEDIQAKIAKECIERGYIFCPRIHCWIFGNGMGT